jgi:hypothetical protein
VPPSRPAGGRGLGGGHSRARPSGEGASPARAPQVKEGLGGFDGEACPCWLAIMARRQQQAAREVDADLRDFVTGLLVAGR